MGVLDVQDEGGGGGNPRARATLTFGREGAPAGVTMDTEGNATFLGTVTSAGGGGGGGVVVTRGVYSGGNPTMPNDAAYVPLDNLTGSIPAAVGDNVEWTPSFMWQPTASQFLELAVIVGGVPVRYGSTGTGTPSVEGDPALYPDPGTYRSAAPVLSFEVEAGDLDGGAVNFALVSTGNGTGTVFSSASFPFRWTAKNFGS